MDKKLFYKELFYHDDSRDLSISRFEECSICGIVGEMGSCFKDSVFIFEIRQVRDVVRDALKLPPEYTHCFFGGYGSIRFDESYHFLTANQAKRLPVYICENCLLQFLAEETTFEYDYRDIDARNLHPSQVSLCDNCGRGWQDESDFCLPHEVCEIEEITDEVREHHNLPLEYDKYIFGFHLLGFEYPIGVGTGNYFLFKDKDLANFNKNICITCLQQAFKGQTIKVYCLSDEKYRDFLIK